MCVTWAEMPKIAALIRHIEDLHARHGRSYILSFDTRVTVSLGKRKGKIVVEFGSVDDLARIVGLMTTDGRDKGLHRDAL